MRAPLDILLRAVGGRDGVIIDDFRIIIIKRLEFRTVESAIMSTVSGTIRRGCVTDSYL